MSESGVATSGAVQLRYVTEQRAVSEKIWASPEFWTLERSRRRVAAR